MSTDKRAPLVKITTPAGIAKFPRLTTPDTKFNKDGDYKITVILDESDEGVSEFKEKILKAEAAALAAAKKELKPGKKLKEADSAIRPHLDDQGNEIEGKFEVNFKMKASGLRKDNTRWEAKPALFDAKGRPSKATVGGGSTVKVSGELNPYNSPTIGAGLSLRLAAVQIIDLKSFGERSAAGYGFAQEDGYEEAETEQGSDSQDGADQGGGETNPPDDAAQPEETKKPAKAGKRRGDF